MGLVRYQGRKGDRVAQIGSSCVLTEADAMHTREGEEKGALDLAC